eukprot:359435-Chlamydomonas_euryale.AAC.3
MSRGDVQCAGRCPATTLAPGGFLMQSNTNTPPPHTRTPRGAVQCAGGHHAAAAGFPVGRRPHVRAGQPSEQFPGIPDAALSAEFQKRIDHLKPIVQPMNETAAPSR